MAANNFRSDRGRYPIAEMVRLIGQADRHGGSTRADKRWRKETASDGYYEPPGLPPAPQLPGHLNAPEQAYELNEHCHDEKVYDAGYQPCAAGDKYQNENPYVRRRSSRATRDPVVSPTTP